MNITTDIPPGLDLQAMVIVWHGKHVGLLVDETNWAWWKCSTPRSTTQDAMQDAITALDAYQARVISPKATTQ